MSESQQLIEKLDYLKESIKKINQNQLAYIEPNAIELLELICKSSAGNTYRALLK